MVANDVRGESTAARGASTGMFDAEVVMVDRVRGESTAARVTSRASGDYRGIAILAG